MNISKSTILVTGATGFQGGATARALLAGGWPVRALVRNPNSAAAQALAMRGAEVFQGDWDDLASLERAMASVHGVFSVQLPTFHMSDDGERRHGFKLVKAARQGGVRHFVHTSVCETDRRTQFPDWESGRWNTKYWTDKWDIEEAVRQAGFESWTVLKPALMMHNFALPTSAFMFPHLKQDQILTALLPTNRVQLIAADDVGTFARAAFEQPERFNRQNIDLASEALTMGEVADVLSRVLGRKIASVPVSPDEALAAGLFSGWVRSQEWNNLWGYRADIAALAQWGVPLMPFEAWVEKHMAEFSTVA